VESHVPEWYYALSQKEREIIVLISKGFAVKEIEEQVFLAEQTVRNYISNIYKKLGVKNRAEIIRLVLNTRLPELLPKSGEEKQ
jgi:DNA-binding NarL/FixJ family response regulator